MGVGRRRLEVCVIVDIVVQCSQLFEWLEEGTIGDKGSSCTAGKSYLFSSWETLMHDWGEKVQ